MKNTYGFKLKSEKDYLNALSVDSENIRLRLRLADFYIRNKKKKKGLEQYCTAAEKLQVVGKTHSVMAIYRLVYSIDPHWDSVEEHLSQEISDKNQSMAVSDFKEHNLTDFIKKIDIFKDLPDQEIAQIANALNIRKFYSGDVIIRQNEEGDSIFLLLKGSVRIYFDDDIGKSIELAYLTKGDFFGEMGFFGNKIRQASVQSVDDSILLELKKDQIEALFAKYRAIEDVFLKFYHERVLDIVLALTPIFTPLEPQIRKEIAAKFNLVKFNKDSTIVKEGDPGDSMFIIKSGTVRIVKVKDNQANDLAKLNTSEFFGEIGLVTGQKRTADVIADTDVELMKLDKKDIDMVVTKYPEVLNILRDFINERSKDTFSKLMEIKRLSLKKGIV